MRTAFPRSSRMGQTPDSRWPALGGGIEEEKKPELRTTNLATIARGVLFLPEASSRKPQAASLLDATGRKILDLKSGANDVRALAPGVYFVREEPQAANPKTQAVRKVVITK